MNFFLNILRAAFTSKDPKSAKKTDDQTVFLRFFDLSVKAVFKHVGEIEPWRAAQKYFCTFLCMCKTLSMGSML